MGQAAPGWSDKRRSTSVATLVPLATAGSLDDLNKRGCVGCVGGRRGGHSSASGGLEPAVLVCHLRCQHRRPTDAERSQQTKEPRPPVPSDCGGGDGPLDHAPKRPHPVGDPARRCEQPERPVSLAGVGSGRPAQHRVWPGDKEADEEEHEAVGEGAPGGDQGVDEEEQSRGDAARAHCQQPVPSQRLVRHVPAGERADDPAEVEQGGEVGGVCLWVPVLLPEVERQPEHQRVPRELDKEVRSPKINQPGDGKGLEESTTPPTRLLGFAIAADLGGARTGGCRGLPRGLGAVGAGGGAWRRNRRAGRTGGGVQEEEVEGGGGDSDNVGWELDCLPPPPPRRQVPSECCREDPAHLL
eukprot:m.289301 g.289301  ORF g.289301 m.289301 type:complete len:356 (+) comp16224_c0_seq5:542-1609(+)